MSPEQFNDPDSVDHRTDIYGLGCILYHCLVGRPAFDDAEMMKIIQRKMDGEVPSPRQVKPELRTELDLLVKDMLQPDRNRRPTYDDLLRRCENLRKNLAFSRRPTSGSYAVLPPAGAAAAAGPAAPSRRPTPPGGAVGPKVSVPQSQRLHNPATAYQKKLGQDPIFWLAMALLALIVLGGIGSLVMFTKLLNGARNGPLTHQNP